MLWPAESSCTGRGRGQSLSSERCVLAHDDIENSSTGRGVSDAEDDHVIQAFTADRTDQSLDIWVLPGRSRGSDDLGDAHRANAMPEYRTIRFVSVPQQIARCSVPRKGLGNLARKPALRRICGDFEVNDPSAIEAEHDQGIKKLERCGGDHSQALIRCDRWTLTKA